MVRGGCAAWKRGGGGRGVGMARRREDRSAAGLGPGALPRDPHLPGTLLRSLPTGARSGLWAPGRQGRARSPERLREPDGRCPFVLPSSWVSDTAAAPQTEWQAGHYGKPATGRLFSCFPGVGQAPNLLIPLWGPWVLYRTSHICRLTMGRNPHQ